MKETNSELLKINEKLDQLLEAQKRARIYAWIRGVLWLIFIVIFVVLPFYYAYDFIHDPSKYLDFESLNKFSGGFKDIINNLSGLL